MSTGVVTGTVHIPIQELRKAFPKASNNALKKVANKGFVLAVAPDRAYHSQETGYPISRVKKINAPFHGFKSQKQYEAFARNWRK